MSTVKYGDTHEIILTVRDSLGMPVDLTGTTVRVLAQPRGGDTVVLSAALGVKKGTVVHQLTGTLPVASYRVEVEVTATGAVRRAPSEGYGTLDVVPSLS